LAIGQENKFEWQNLTFEIGQRREIKLKFDFDGLCTVRPCYKFAENALTIDTIVAFLNKNPNLQIEIRYHTNQRGKTEYNLKLSEKLAKGTKEELKIHGVAEERMTFKGYGESKPIISEKEIKKMKSEEEKEVANRRNKRIEIIITKK
jgi:outer membrane protein OmpA-like peptidoglycan-associated protein